MINGRKTKEEERTRVGEVMLLSCLFLIGASRDGDHNNSFVERGWRESFLCASVCTRAGVCVKVCVCVCVECAD